MLSDLSTHSVTHLFQIQRTPLLLDIPKPTPARRPELRRLTSIPSRRPVRGTRHRPLPGGARIPITGRAPIKVSRAASARRLEGVLLSAASLGDELVLQCGFALVCDALRGVARGGTDVACATATGGYDLFISTQRRVDGSLTVRIRAMIAANSGLVGVIARKEIKTYPVNRTVSHKLTPALLSRLSTLGVDTARRRPDEVSCTTAAGRHDILSASLRLDVGHGSW